MRRFDLLAALAVGAWLGAAPAHAQTWVGGNAGDPHEWVETANWTPATVPGGTATFGSVANTTSVANDAGVVTVGTINFTGSALGYTFSIDNAFTVNGNGVVNNSPNGQGFTIASGKTLTFRNASSANAGNDTVFYTNAGGKMIFNDTSIAGTANIFSSFSGTTPSVTFNNSSSAGSATFTSNPANFPTYTFNNTSTAANAKFVLVDATLTFNNSSNAGNMVLTMPNLMHPATITFNDTSSAANANITNISPFGSGGIVQFLAASTAGNATITNNPNPFFGPNGGGQLMFGQFGGGDTANAGTATIINNSGGSTTFVQFTSAANATITNNAGGGTTFEENSTAANARITNNSGGGLTFAFGSPTAGNAVIINNAGGEVDFGIAGFYPIIIDTATAGNATITNNGTVVFSSATTAGNATITTNAGGFVSFVEASTGGAARFIMNAGVFDMSGLTTGGMTAGSLEGAGNVFLGGNALTVGLNNLSTTFSGVISDGGSSGGTGGQLIKTGSGNFTLTNVETYTGATAVNGGTLTVLGSIAASSGVTVNSGGTLAGTGTVAATTVNAGGTLAPGNGSVGTLTVNGKLTFNAGSTFLVDVTPAIAGKVIVNGTANLAGTVEAVFLPGSYLATSYTILTATGGRIGTFSNLVTVDLPAFLSASLTYDPNDVMLVTLRSNLNRPGLTQNQAAVAAALDNSFNTGRGTLTGLSFVPANQIPAALNALSGEGTSGTQQTAFGAADRFTTVMSPTTGVGTPLAGPNWQAQFQLERNLPYASEPTDTPVFKAMPGKAPPEPEGARYRAWFTGFDATWRLDGQAEPGSAALRHSTAGGAAGLDYQVNPNLLVGVAGGGSSSTFSEPDRATSGTLDGAHIGTYGVGRWGPWYAAGALAFNRFENKYTRAIGGVGPTESATGKFDSNMLSGRFELGYRQIFSGFAVTPFAAVQFAELWQPGYSETSTMIGGAPGVLGLTYTAQTVSSLPTFLGAQFDTRVTLQNGIVWLPYARLSWVHEFESTRDVNAGFITLPVTNFTVFGPSAARDAARVDLGSKLAINRSVALFASFDGEFSDRSRMYAGKGGVRVTW